MNMSRNNNFYDEGFPTTHNRPSNDNGSNMSSLRYELEQSIRDHSEAVNNDNTAESLQQYDSIIDDMSCGNISRTDMKLIPMGRRNAGAPFSAGVSPSPSSHGISNNHNNNQSWSKSGGVSMASASMTKLSWKGLGSTTTSTNKRTITNNDNRTGLQDDATLQNIPTSTNILGKSMRSLLSQTTGMTSALTNARRDSRSSLFDLSLPLLPHETRKASFTRLFIAILCFLLSLILTLTIGRGQLGLAAARSIYLKSIYQPPINAYLPPSDSAKIIDISLGHNDLENHVVEPINLIPDSFQMNIANIALPFYRSASTKNENNPFFWFIPRSGGSVFRIILHQCLGLVEASADGVGRESSQLDVFEDEHGFQFVNIDTSTTNGLQHALELDYAESGIADVTVSPLLYSTASLFNPTNQGRLFTLLRHPVDRAYSVYLGEMRTEAFSSSPITFLEFIEKGYLLDNFVTRSLVNKATGPILPSDLTLAMELLRTKAVIGLFEKLPESLDRFERYFGWKDNFNQDTYMCQETFLARQVPERHEDIQEGTAAWAVISAHEMLDMQIYAYAEKLFENCVYGC